MKHKHNVPKLLYFNFSNKYLSLACWPLARIVFIHSSFFLSNVILTTNINVSCLQQNNIIFQTWKQTQKKSLLFFCFCLFMTNVPSFQANLFGSFPWSNHSKNFCMNVRNLLKNYSM